MTDIINLSKGSPIKVYFSGIKDTNLSDFKTIDPQQKITIDTVGGAGILHVELYGELIWKGAVPYCDGLIKIYPEQKKVLHDGRILPETLESSSQSYTFILIILLTIFLISLYLFLNSKI